MLGGALAAGGHLAAAESGTNSVPGTATLAVEIAGSGAGAPGESAPGPPATTTATSAAAPTTTTTVAPPSTTTVEPTSTTTEPSSTGPSSTETTKAPAAATDDSAAAQVLALVNAERADAGCAPVKVDARLTESAQRHSQDMAEQDYFSHASKDGRSFADRIEAAGYPSPAAENIAKGQRSAEQVMRAWMKSPGHRKNILDCSLTALGTGVVTDGWYWTQNFGR